MTRARTATVLTTTITAAAVGAALAVAPAATAAPVVSEPKATGLFTPLQFDVSKRGIIVSQSFAGVISKVRRDGSLRNLVVARPVTEGGTASVGGVASRGRTIAYTYSSTAPGPEGAQDAAQLRIRKPNGKTKVLANLKRFEERRNPDARRTYGFVGLDEACSAAVDRAGIPGVSGDPYTGIVESNPYSVAAAPNGGWYVADAAANAVLRVSGRGRIKVAYVGRPQPYRVTADVAATLGLPECTVGESYRFEPVPTDVEVTKRGKLVVSHLPGGPEDPSLGARGSVVKVNPRNGRSYTVARGLLGATNVAIGRKGRIYVSELFGNRVSVVRKGRVRPLVDLPAPAAVETRRHLFVAIDTFPPAPNGKIVKVRVP